MKKTAFLPLLFGCCLSVSAQPEAIYDEAQVPAYELPDPLLCADGTRVQSVRDWEKKRRPELLQLFADQEYGRTPGGKVKTSFQLLSENPHALGGLATSQQVMLTFSGQGQQRQALLLAYIPNQRQGRVPVFIGLNFMGNHSITSDPTIAYSPYFERIADKNSPLLMRNNQFFRWPLEDIVRRGYAVVTMCYQDIFPDNPNGQTESIIPLFPENQDGDARWQALGAWAWGCSRMADWVERQPWSNPRQLALIGHSRQGKAALWAGAQDERFEVVISNNSGCGGAALSKRAFGETVGRITRSFPHWFCPAFSKYGEHESSLPFDQHELLALMAPRHVYVASAEEDRWSDPNGEFLAVRAASPVYALYGLKGIERATQPVIHDPLHGQVAYHIRAGKHDVTPYDWHRYMDYCDRVFGHPNPTLRPSLAPAARAGHVLVIGIDGWGGYSFAKAHDIPHLRSLMAQGCYTLHKRSVLPSSSAVNWASMFNGSCPELHGYTQWNSKTPEIPSAELNEHAIFPSVFSLLRKARPDVITGCIAEWDGIKHVVDTLAIDNYEVATGWENDHEKLCRMAEQYIIDRKPTLFAVCWDQLDHTGHAEGHDTPEYYQTLAELDVFVGRLVQALKQAAIYDDTIIIVTADHGGKEKGHGGKTLLEMEHPFIICGKGIRQGMVIAEPMMQYDTAATIAHIFALPTPYSWVGHPLLSVFK